MVCTTGASAALEGGARLEPSLVRPASHYHCARPAAGHVPSSGNEASAEVSVHTALHEHEPCPNESLQQ
jgi:hypothetical protein